MRFNLFVAVQAAFPKKTAQMEPDIVFKFIEKSEMVGITLGITSTIALELWIFLAFKTDGKSLTHPKVKRHFQYALNPDETMVELGTKVIDMDVVNIEEVL